MKHNLIKLLLIFGVAFSTMAYASIPCSTLNGASLAASIPPSNFHQDGTDKWLASSNPKDSQENLWQVLVVFKDANKNADHFKLMRNMISQYASQVSGDSTSGKGCLFSGQDPTTQASVKVQYWCNSGKCN